MKRCVFGCDGKLHVFGFPKDPAIKAQWIAFAFEEGQFQSSLDVFICIKHFTADSFANMPQYVAGFAQKLRLNLGAVPTIRNGAELQPILKSKWVELVPDGVYFDTCESGSIPPSADPTVACDVNGSTHRGPSCNTPVNPAACCELLQLRLPSVFNKMNTLREQRRFCDTTLIFAGPHGVTSKSLRFHGHRVVLAASSVFLRDQFLLGEGEKQLVLTGFARADIGMKLLLSCYTGLLEVPLKERKSYIQAASQLLMSHVMEKFPETPNQHTGPDPVLGKPDTQTEEVTETRRPDSNLECEEEMDKDEPSIVIQASIEEEHEEVDLQTVESKEAQVDIASEVTDEHSRGCFSPPAGGDRTDTNTENNMATAQHIEKDIKTEPSEIVIINPCHVPLITLAEESMDCSQDMVKIKPKEENLNIKIEIVDERSRGCVSPATVGDSIDIKTENVMDTAHHIEVDIKTELCSIRNPCRVPFTDSLEESMDCSRHVKEIEPKEENLNLKIEIIDERSRGCVSPPTGDDDTDIKTENDVDTAHHIETDVKTEPCSEIAIGNPRHEDRSKDTNQEEMLSHELEQNERAEGENQKGAEDTVDSSHLLCLVCGMVFQDLQVYADHVHGHGRHLCLICKKVFVYKGNLKRHASLFHAKTHTFSCLLCHKTFAHMQAMEAHLSEHIEEKSFKCPLCAADFSHQNVLRRHLKAVHGKRYNTLNKVVG